MAHIRRGDDGAGCAGRCSDVANGAAMQATTDAVGAVTGTLDRDDDAEGRQAN